MIKTVLHQTGGISLEGFERLCRYVQPGCVLPLLFSPLPKSGAKLIDDAMNEPLDE